MLRHARSRLPFRMGAALDGALSRGYASAVPVSTVGNAVVDVKDDAEFIKHMKEIADNGGVGVVDFTAKWCGPCKMIAPIYERYSQQYKEVKFLKVDIDSADLQRTVIDHEITGVPAFFFYKGAKRLDSFTGARPDVLQQLLLLHAEPKLEPDAAQ